MCWFAHIFSIDSICKNTIKSRSRFGGSLLLSAAGGGLIWVWFWVLVYKRDFSRFGMDFMLDFHCFGGFFFLKENQLGGSTILTPPRPINLLKIGPTRPIFRWPPLSIVDRFLWPKLFDSVRWNAAQRLGAIFRTLILN